MCCNLSVDCDRSSNRHRWWIKIWFMWVVDNLSDYRSGSSQSQCYMEITCRINYKKKNKDLYLRKAKWGVNISPTCAERLNCHLSNNAINDVHTYSLQSRLRSCRHTVKALWPWMWITLPHIMIKIFENRISNKPVTFLLDAAEPLQCECVWSPGRRQPGNCEPRSPFPPLAVVRGTGRASAEVVRSPTIRSNKPLWDLREHCCKYTQAACKVRAGSDFWGGGRLTRRVWTFTVIK